jgi:hypothetical protein
VISAIGGSGRAAARTAGRGRATAAAREAMTVAPGSVSRRGYVPMTSKSLYQKVR